MGKNNKTVKLIYMIFIYIYDDNIRNYIFIAMRIHKISRLVNMIDTIGVEVLIMESQLV